MIEQYIQINRILRKIIFKIWDAQDAHMYDSESYIIGTLGTYIRSDIKDLEFLWPEGVTKEPLEKLKEKTKDFDSSKFYEVIHKDIPQIEDIVDDFFSSQQLKTETSNIINFLHPIIVQSSYAQLKNEHYRDAVFNALVAVFDLIRKKTKSDKDGFDLIGEVFSLNNPKLVFSSLKTKSGKNEQKGFLQILQGAYLGIRNPKAHTLESDLNEFKAIQYLIFASLLARRVEEANKPRQKKKQKIP